MVATSSNHAKIIVLNEVCGEYVWLTSILETSRIIINKEPTTSFEDNCACVAQIKKMIYQEKKTKQIKEKYNKSDMTKHNPRKSICKGASYQQSESIFTILNHHH